MLLFKSFLLLLAVVSVRGQDDAARKLSQLYQTMRAIALPGAQAASKRLVLFIPGQFLYERDYYPGSVYVNFVNNPDRGRFEEIPPIKQQNLFRLVDPVVGLSQLQAQPSGESFSVIYRQILGQIEIIQASELASEIAIRQNASITYLTEIVPDPKDMTNMLSRWELYRQYERLYNNERRNLEEILETERLQRQSTDYQLWFQRNYPALQAEVDGAFMDWLVNGKKDIVEVYRSRLDQSSPGTLILEAKAALRASGVVSLDRTQTLYPVEYTPSNWYTFLRDPILRMTPDQMNVEIGKLQSQIKFLEAILLFNGSNTECTIDSSIDTLQGESDDETNALEMNVTTMMTSRCKCAVATSSGTTGEDCTNYQDELDISLSGLDTSAEKYQIRAALQAARDGNSAQVRSLVERLNDEIDELNGELLTAGFGIPLEAGAATQTGYDRGDGWLQFSYQSSETETNVATSSSYTSTLVVRGGWFPRTSSRTERRQSYESSLETSDVSLSGELMRVTIRFPWFRPELFRSDRITFNPFDPNQRVSPGPPNPTLNQDDIRFAQVAANPNYLMPQYVTGILLVRNMTLNFQTTRDTTSSFVRESNSRSAGYSYGPFCVSAAYSTSSRSTQTSYRATTQANGISIGIPGVQMIGYYTEIVPVFPRINLDSDAINDYPPTN